MKKKIAYGLLILIACIQLIRTKEAAPESIVAENDFIQQMAPPENVANLIQNTCYDCHSFQTKYPWYSEVAPVSWWTNHHVEEAREELNFSEWATFEQKRKDHKLEEIVEMLEEHEMPLKEYTWMHKEAKLTDIQREEIIAWVRETMEATEEEKVELLHLNRGDKWQVNDTINESINKITTMLAAEIEDGRLSLYVAMSQKISAEIENIIRANTQEGELQEQLNNYLKQLVPLVEDLENIETEEEALIKQKDALQYLNRYSVYFE